LVIPVSESKRLELGKADALFAGTQFARPTPVESFPTARPMPQ